jgi:hypothetical protein
MIVNELISQQVQTSPDPASPAQPSVTRASVPTPQSPAPPTGPLWLFSPSPNPHSTVPVHHKQQSQNKLLLVPATLQQARPRHKAHHAPRTTGWQLPHPGKAHRSCLFPALICSLTATSLGPSGY